MVVVAPMASSARSSTSASNVPKNRSAASRQHDASLNPSRQSLSSSEKYNAAVARTSRTKEISSRYLSSYSSSSSSTTSSSYHSNTTTSSPHSPSFRRCPSPLSNHRPSTPSSFSQRPASRRSHSVDRTRPTTPDVSNAARALCTTTRSLSVSFQGESFFYQTNKAKTISPAPSRKHTSERRRASTPARNSCANVVEKPSDHHYCWPASRNRQSTMLTKSLDWSSDKDPVLSTVQMLRQSALFDDGTKRSLFDGAELSVSSDTDSLSSGSNSGTPDLRFCMRRPVSSNDVGMPVRLRLETNSRIRSVPQPGTPLSSTVIKNFSSPKLPSVRRSSVHSPLPSPRPASPLRKPVRPSSPKNLTASPSKRFPTPSSTRGISVLSSSTPGGLLSSSPSIKSFAAEVRRSKMGESRIDEAHILRLLYNQHLQWMHVNARTNTVLMVQRVSAEKLYNAWLNISELYDSVTVEKIKLRFLKHDLKQATIIKEQIIHLEEWFNLERDHLSSLCGAIEALKATTLHLPVMNGARAELKEVKDAVGSAVDVMQAMGASVCSLLSKMEGTSYLVSQLSQVAAQEQSLLDQARDFLSTVATLHVKYCSRRVHYLQLKRTPKQKQM